MGPLSAREASVLLPSLSRRGLPVFMGLPVRSPVGGGIAMGINKEGSPITIAILDHSPEIGGAESSLLTFLRHVDRRKLDAVVVLAGEGAFSERLQNEGIAVHIIPASPQFLRLKRGYGWKSFSSFLAHLVGIQSFFIRLCLFL